MFGPVQSTVQYLGDNPNWAAASNWDLNEVIDYLKFWSMVHFIKDLCTNLKMFLH